MSLITMGLGHLTVITMGLGDSYHIHSVFIRPLQRGTVTFVDDTPEVKVIDQPVSTEMTSVDSKEATFEK